LLNISIFYQMTSFSGFNMVNKTLPTCTGETIQLAENNNFINFNLLNNKQIDLKI